MNKKIFQISIVIILIQFLAGCDKSDRTSGSATELYERGVQLFDEQRFSEAELYFTQAIERFSGPTERFRIGEAYCYLADISAALGQFQTAISRFSEAEKSCKEENDFRGGAKLNLRAGDFFYEIGHFRPAELRYRDAFEAFTAINITQGKGLAAMRLARVLIHQNDLEGALQSYEEALPLLRVSGDSAAVSMNLSIKAEWLLLKGRTQEALRFYSLALSALNRYAEPIIYIKALIGRSNALRLMKRYDEALRSLTDAVNFLRMRKIGKKYQPLIFFAIGKIYEENNNAQTAVKFYNDGAVVARDAGDRLSEQFLRFYALLAGEQILEKQGMRIAAESAQQFVQAASRFKELENKSGESVALARAGVLFKSAGNFVQAKTVLERALELVESGRGEYVSTEFTLPFVVGLRINELCDGWYYALAEVFLQLGMIDRAWAVLEREGLLEPFEVYQTISPVVRYTQIADDVALMRKEIQQRKIVELELGGIVARKSRGPEQSKVVSLRQQIIQFDASIAQRSERLVKAYPNYEPLLRAATVSVTELQSFVPHGTVVVRFFPGEESISIFTLTRSGMKVTPSYYSRATLISLIQEYLKLLNNPSVYAGSEGEASLPQMMRFEEVSKNLYDILIEPIEGQFERGLLIIPSKEFGLFPFHSLIRASRGKEGRYIIELTNVDYLSSLLALKFRTIETRRFQKLAAVGNPTGKNWALDYELKDVRSFVREAELCTGVDASWKSLSTIKGDVLQLATEFHPSVTGKDLGVFILSDGSSVESVVKIPFERLVSIPPFPVIMLSNQSSGGKALTPVSALLLKMNGTADVFFNVWQSDRKTSKLFSEFFFTHLASGIAAGDAYRQALLNLIRTRETRHPHSWSQFFHFGIG